MKFSLVVVTTDRLHLVERLFAGLEVQSHRDFEVILVCGPAVSEEAVTVLTKKFSGLNLNVLTSKDHCLSRSRNLALPLATGDVIAFPDDDCLYEPDTLAACATVFEHDQRLDALLATPKDIGGSAEAPAPAKAALRPVNRYSVFGCSQTWLQFYRKECVAAVGNFDETLGPDLPCGSGEDTDYALRALLAGFAVRQSPAVIVRHPDVDLRDPALPGKVRRYAAGRMYLLRKHRLPLWFRLANIAYPLARLPVECLRACLPVARYRWGMFRARACGIPQGCEEAHSFENCTRPQDKVPEKG